MSEISALKNVSKNIILILINNIGLKTYQQQLLYDRYINEKLIKNIASEYHKSERKINSDLKKSRERMFYFAREEYGIQDNLTKMCIEILLKKEEA